MNVNSLSNEKLYRCIKASFQHEEKRPLEYIDFTTKCALGDNVPVNIWVYQKPKFRELIIECNKGLKKDSLFELLNNLLYLFAMADGYSLTMDELKGYEVGSNDMIDLFDVYMDIYDQIVLLKLPGRPFNIVDYNALTPEILVKWNNLLNEHKLFIEILKNLSCKTGLTNDIVLALFIDLTNWIYSLNHDCKSNRCNKVKKLKSIIELYGFDQNIFGEEYKGNESIVFAKIINTRNAIMHASYKKEIDCLHKNEITFYRLKFALMYTLIAFDYLGIDYHNSKKLIDYITCLDDNIREQGEGGSSKAASKKEGQCYMINVRYIDHAYSGPEFSKVIILENKGIQFYVSLEERKEESENIRIININTNENVDKTEIDNILFSIEKYLMFCDGFFLPIQQISYFNSSFSNEKLKELSNDFLKLRLKYYKTWDPFCHNEYNLIPLQKAFNQKYIEKWQKRFEFTGDGKSLNIGVQLYFYMMSSLKFDIEVRLFYMVVTTESLANLLDQSKKKISEKIKFLIETYGSQVFDGLDGDEVAMKCSQFRNQITHYNPKKSINITEAEALDYIIRFSLLYRMTILKKLGVQLERNRLLDAIRYLNIQKESHVKSNQSIEIPL